MENVETKQENTESENTEPANQLPEALDTAESIDAEEARLWAMLVSRQGSPFHTAKNLEFTYTIRGGEMFVDRRSKSITKATISKAFRRVREDGGHEIQGPKALNCFGAPYVWAIFTALGVVVPGERKTVGRKRGRKPAGTMLIRTAEERDLPELLEIYNYEVQNGVATFDLNPKSLEDWAIWFKAHNTGNHPLIVAEWSGAVAGYASLSSYREKEAYAATVELSVYVAPGYRRRGVARKLIADILEDARRRDDIHTVISVITDGNEASVALHEEFGFVYSGTLKEVGEKFGRKLDVVNYQLMV